MNKIIIEIIKNGLIVIGILTILSCDKCNTSTKSDYSNLSGPYLGQMPPGDMPEIFAPDLISTSMYTRDIAITPDGQEIYFCVSALNYNLIFYTKQLNNSWSEPVLAPFISNFNFTYFEPHITPDGSKMLFLSDMPTIKDKDSSQNIWVVERIGDEWGEPYDIGEPINTDGNEYFPSTTRDGTLYFTRAEKGSRLHYIYRSKYLDGNYSEPERLNDYVNCGTNRFNAFIDPDERFIIVSVIGMEDGLGGTDYYIVFRDENDNWSKPVNLGAQINQSKGAEWSPYISPDGKYFFFMSSRIDNSFLLNNDFPPLKELLEYSNKPGYSNPCIYWVKSDFLFDLKIN